MKFKVNWKSIQLKVNENPINPMEEAVEKLQANFQPCNLQFPVYKPAPKKEEARPVKIVNQPSEYAMEIFNQAVSYKGNECLMREEMKLKRIGSGCCGSVYAVGQDYVLKVAYGDRDGEALDALQGLPLVPTLYAYTTNKSGYQFTLIQRIHGEVIGEVQDSFSPLNFDGDNFKAQAAQFFSGCRERGWTPSDVHNYNVMVDEEGRCWVIDFGLFSKGAKIDKHARKIFDIHVEFMKQRYSEKKQVRYTAIENLVYYAKRRAESEALGLNEYA